jgi:hypothetical protein
MAINGEDLEKAIVINNGELEGYELKNLDEKARQELARQVPSEPQQRLDSKLARYFSEIEINSPADVPKYYPGAKTEEEINYMYKRFLMLKNQYAPQPKPEISTDSKEPKTVVFHL